MYNTIVKLEITGLFGRFNYKLDLPNTKSKTFIITAPNGYGKSTILRIIGNFSSGNYYYFLHENFKKISFSLSDGDEVIISQNFSDISNKEITISSKKEGNNIITIQESSLDNSIYAIDSVLPFLTRISRSSWRHDRTGEIFDVSTIFERYGDNPLLKRRMKNHSSKWIEEITGSLNIFSITTNRLSYDLDKEYRDNKNLLMVDNLAADISEEIKSAIRQQFEAGRKNETSFPTRVIRSLNENRPIEKEEILSLIDKVKKLEMTYSPLGLLSSSETSGTFDEHLNLEDRAGRIVLKTYLTDILKKFSLFEGLAGKLQLFCDSINELVSFKKIETSADEGIIIKIVDRHNNKLEKLSVLSSGEQHLLVLIGKLIFNTKPNSLVLIDEPEISFHPEWQEKFLEIVEQIQVLNSFQLLIATHSPYLIGDRWENVIELAEQYSDMESLVHLGEI